MSGKLDQSLEDIVKDHKRTSRGPVAGKRRVIKRKTITGPTTAGITKNNKNAKATKATLKPGNTTAPSGRGESKITVYGLPLDVSEQQIQDYFSKTVGPVKKAFLVYGPNGQSRGISTIIFQRSGSAVEAAKQLNGVKVDNRAMRIEVNLTADQAPTPAPLGDRIANGATKAKGKANGKPAKGRAVGGQKPARPGRKTNKGKPKTTEELDAEMTDYFGPSGAPAGSNAAAQPAANGGEAAMEDEIM